MLKGLTHAALSVTDVEKSVEFYKKIPGITEQFRMKGEDGTTRLVYLKVGPLQFIELFPRADSPHEKTTNAGYVHICLECDDIQEMYRQVVANGITPTVEIQKPADWTWQFWVNDPDGCPIEFHQFTDESLQLDNPKKKA